MKDNMIYLHNYTSAANKPSARSQKAHKLLDYAAAVADTLATVSISACTIFCMYLAYTML